MEQASAEEERERAATAETPAQATEHRRASVVAIKGNIAADAERKRRMQALELQRERILSEKTASPHRRSALSAALLEIEEQLSQLGWTIHL